MNSSSLKELFTHFFSSRRNIYIFFTLIFVWIILANFKWGYSLLGNDSFAPEQNPGITFNRLFQDPGWRGYRALGVPSDSEQADISRVLVFLLLRGVGIPAWFISQMYLLMVFVLAILSAGHLTRVALGLKRELSEEDKNKALLFGGLFYMSSLLTVWIFFFPVQLFVAAYAFLPFVLWKFYEYLHKPSVFNLLLLALASVLLGIAGITATMFLVTFAVIGSMSFAAFLSSHISKKALLVGLGVFLLVNVYWLMPFALYVKSNTGALQESLINRKITSLQTQNEDKYTQLPNTFSYRFSWLDDKLSTGDFAYTKRNWYMDSPFGLLMSYVPFVLAIFGGYFMLRKKYFPGLIFVAQAILGIWLLKGTNPPFGIFYGLFENMSEVFEQVFRWRSSKFWPFTAIAVPILASYALIELSKKKFLTWLPIGISVLLLIYMLPLFIGHMIRSSMYVKVPSEYSELSKYLQEHDPNGRVYAAPEANTLYFRNYDWGFFGSVALNYLIPNPVFEKALVIGSAESEHGFEVIKNAYYSRNPDLFTNALRQYNVAYVLKDSHATKGESGYDYSQDVLLDSVDNNKHLENIWSRGALTLYSVSPAEVSEEPITLASGHDHGRLAGMQAYTRLQTVTSKAKKEGTIFPFSLTYSDMKFEDTYLILRSSIQNPGTYILNLDPAQLTDVSTYVSFTNGVLTMQPVFPEFRLDRRPLPINIPKKSFPVTDVGDFVTVGESIIDLRKKSQAISQKFNTINTDSLFYGWKKEQDLNLLNKESTLKLYCNNKELNTVFNVDKAGVTCGTGPFELLKSTILEGKLRISADIPAKVSVCFKSGQLQRCTDIQRHMYFEGTRDYTLQVPHIFQAGDSVELFLNITPISQNKNSRITISDLHMSIFAPKLLSARLEDTSQSYSPIQFTTTGTVPLDIILPLSSSNANMAANSFMQTPFDMSVYADNEVSSYTVEADKDGFTMINTESSSNFNAMLPVVDTDLMLFAFKGENHKGIPLDIRIRADKQGAALYENKLYEAKETNLVGFVYIPEGNPSLNIEVSHVGIGPNPSDNTINAIALQSIPSWWLTLAFVPEKESSTDFVEATYEHGFYTAIVDKPATILLNTAHSPYWSIKKLRHYKKQVSLSDYFFAEPVNAQNVISNGWNQGFKVEKPGTYVVFFWPNIIIFGGYILTSVILIGLLGYAVRKKLQHKRS